MTPKQQRFVEEYLIDLNAIQAAVRAGLSFGQIGGGFYVYFLIDDSSGQIIYVGKGKGRRMRQHRFDAHKPDSTNQIKALRIIQCGDNLREEVFAGQLTEPEAMGLEKSLISALKEYGLTNISSGNVHPAESHLARIERNIAAILPYEEWISIAHPEALRQAERLKGSTQEFYEYFCNAWERLRLEAVDRLNSIGRNSNASRR